MSAKQCPFRLIRASLVAQMVKNLAAMQETQVWSLGWEDPLEKVTTTHSSILAWRIPWIEEPGGLQSMGSQRVGHGWAANTLTFSLTHRKCIGKVVTFFFSSLSSWPSFSNLPLALLFLCLCSSLCVGIFEEQGGPAYALHVTRAVVSRGGYFSAIASLFIYWQKWQWCRHGYLLLKQTKRVVLEICMQNLHNKTK